MESYVFADKLLKLSLNRSINEVIFITLNIFKVMPDFGVQKTPQNMLQLYHFGIYGFQSYQ